MKPAPMPVVQVNTKQKYLGNTATVTGCWWDGGGWRYEVYISRGKNKGYWVVSEGGLLSGTTINRGKV